MDLQDGQGARPWTVHVAVQVDEGQPRAAVVGLRLRAQGRHGWRCGASEPACSVVRHLYALALASPVPPGRFREEALA